MPEPAWVDWLHFLALWKRDAEIIARTGVDPMTSVASGTRRQ